jgi:hypothetical protein
MLTPSDREWLHKAVTIAETPEGQYQLKTVFDLKKAVVKLGGVALMKSLFLNRKRFHSVSRLNRLERRANKVAYDIEAYAKLVNTYLEEMEAFTTKLEQECLKELKLDSRKYANSVKAYSATSEYLLEINQLSVTTRYIENIVLNSES